MIKISVVHNENLRDLIISYCYFVPIAYYKHQIFPSIWLGEDVVQCVPTKKGHQILFKGYTYVFKARLQCGSEQWCCSYRQKTGCISTINMQTNGVEVVRDFHNHKKPMFSTEEELPEWVSIYFVKTAENKHRCNICDVTVTTDGENSKLLDHIKANHNDVYDLHKENPHPVGFRIEFLHLNVLKEDGGIKHQPVILGEVCETAGEEIIQPISDKDDVVHMEVNEQIVLTPKEKEKSDNRKRSWVWKYFHQMSSIIFRCTLCNVVLSIKGCNTNNMNRHVRTRHPSIYRNECLKKRDSVDQMEDLLEADIPMAVKTEEICASDKDLDELESPTSQRQRRSWIWLYFTRISATSAQCKLCNRNIVHGGNATGNMNRHLKMIHRKTGENHHWVWKVFDCHEKDFYSCKICQYQCMKFADVDKSVSFILDHLRVEHGVVSGDQIITGTDDVYGEETN